MNECVYCAANQTEVVYGKGDDHAPIMVVAANPGSVDVASHAPIVGLDGELHVQLWKAAGVPLSKVYRTYAVHHITPGFRKPNKEEIEHCRDYLIDEIRRIKPAVILALGEVPLQALYGIGEHDSYDQEVTDWQTAYDDATLQWDKDIAMWRNLSAADRKVQPRPLKPKAGPKPRKPKAQHVTIKEVMGATLIQSDTGIPMIATYSPAYIRNNHWPHAELVLAHFAKTGRIADGTQTVGKLGTYKVIKTMQELRDLRDYLLGPTVDVIAYDTETTGLKWMYHELLSIQFSGKAGEGFAMPVYYNADGLGGIAFWPEWFDNLKEWLEILKSIFGSKKKKLAQNGLFDMRMLERHTSPHVEAATAFGFKVKGELRDTELLHHSIQESLPHNMTNITAIYTDMPYYEDGIKQYKKAMNKAPNEMLWEYGAADVDGLFRLWEAMRPIAEAQGTDWVLDNITMPMLRVCRDMEERGFPINEEYFGRLSEFYRYQIYEAEKELWDSIPTLDPGWKYNYAPALRDVLFNHLGLQPAIKHRKTESGRGCKDCKDGICFQHLSTGKDALDDMIREGETHPVLQHIKTLKFLTKRQSTYLDGSDGTKGFKRWIRPDGRVHSTQKISRVETGRLASEEPNDKNIPNYVHIHGPNDGCNDPKCDAFYDMAGQLGINSNSAFHDIIEAPKGKGIMTADWAQLEIWVLAYRIYKEFGNRVLLDILESGTDIHMWMARQMFPELDPNLNDKEWRTKYPALRRLAKAADFGVGYGLTAQGMMLRNNCTMEEAEEIIKRYKNIVPVDKYFDSIEKQLDRVGYVENEFERRRHMPHLKLLRKMAPYDFKINNVIQSTIREAINFPIQSSGSDLHSAASAIVNSNKVLRQRGCRVILSVHDSLTFEFEWPDEQAAKTTAHIVKTTMQDVAWNLIKPDGTPLHWKVPVEVEWGQTWGTPTMKLDAAGQYGPA